MTTRPADVLEGLALAAAAVGAREGIVFLKASFDRPAAALEKALAAGAAGGLPVRIARGDDSYVTGEETALLEALEGRRAWPRPKPPLPAAAGFQGRPTLVQNVETLARVAAAVADPEAYRRERDHARLGVGPRRAAGRLRGPAGHAAGADRRRARTRRHRRDRHDLPRRPVGRASHRGAGGHAARSRCAARRGVRAGDGIAPGRRRGRLPAGGRGLAGRVLRARVLRPVPALHGGQRQPGPHAARGGERRRSRRGS